MKTGQLKLDKDRIATEVQLDGKYLINTFNGEDVAGYKQLAVIESLSGLKASD